MKRRYFTIDYQWMEDVSLDAAMVYGHMLKTNTYKKYVEPNTGEVYVQVYNQSITKWFPWLTAYKVREIFIELEDMGYITTLMVKHPNRMYRKIRFNRFLDRNSIKRNMWYDAFIEMNELNRSKADVMTCGCIYSALIDSLVRVYYQPTVDEVIMEYLYAFREDDDIISNRILKFFEDSKFIVNEDDEYMLTEYFESKVDDDEYGYSWEY